MVYLFPLQRKYELQNLKTPNGNWGINLTCEKKNEQNQALQRFFCIDKVMFSACRNVGNRLLPRQKITAP